MNKTIKFFIQALVVTVISLIIALKLEDKI